jgi:hypothetical protein
MIPLKLNQKILNNINLFLLYAIREPIFIEKENETIVVNPALITNITYVKDKNIISINQVFSRIIIYLDSNNYITNVEVLEDG